MDGKVPDEEEKKNPIKNKSSLSQLRVSLALG